MLCSGFLIFDHPHKYDYEILISSFCQFYTYLRIIAVFHLIVEHIKVSLRHRLLLAVEDRCNMRIVRFLSVSQGEEISGLYERRHELCIAQCLHTCVFCIDGMLNCSLPVSILIHHLNTKRIPSLSFTWQVLTGKLQV